MKLSPRRPTLLALVALAVALCPGSSVRAQLLDLDLAWGPDIYSTITSAQTLTYTHNASASPDDNTLVVNGVPTSIRFGGSGTTQYNLSGNPLAGTRNLVLNATLGDTGALIGGTLEIRAGLSAAVGAPYSYATGTTLIAGDLIAFAFDNTADTQGRYSDIFEFIFQPTGGVLFAPPANQPAWPEFYWDTGGIRISVFGATAFNGGFTTSFSSTQGVIDVAPIPEPSTLVGVAGCFFAMAFCRRRSTKLPPAAGAVA